MRFYCVLPYKTAIGSSWGGVTIYIYIYISGFAAFLDFSGDFDGGFMMFYVASEQHIFVYLLSVSPCSHPSGRFKM